MIETVVHVTTIEEWKSVLDIWFKKGYGWYSGDTGYQENYFDSGKRGLWLTDENMILTANIEMHDYHDYIEYSDFMAQQKEANKMETYYVTQGQLDLIEELKDKSFPLYKLTHSGRYKEVGSEMDSTQEKAMLRYVGGDETIEFKVKETLYRLWRIDTDRDKVYMRFNAFGTPSSCVRESDAFTAPLEEIKKHKTISWEIEEVK